MNIFITPDRKYYRRWINVILSVVLAGSAQFLSGRKMAGVIWFFSHTLAVVISIGLEFSPVDSIHYSLIGYAPLLTLLIMCVDGCRRSILPIGLKGWAVLVLIILMIFFVPLLLLRVYVIQPFHIPTGAMSPTLMPRPF